MGRPGADRPTAQEEELRKENESPSATRSGFFLILTIIFKVVIIVTGKIIRFGRDSKRESRLIREAFMKNYQNISGPPKRIKKKKNMFSLEIRCGANIQGSIAEAIDVARGLDAVMQFEFNDVMVSVRRDSNPELIYRDWNRAMSDFIEKKVGPNPNPVLTDEEKASDARIGEKRRKEILKRELERKAKEDAIRQVVEVRLGKAPEIEIANAKFWQEFKDKNQDPYGHAAVVYSERWARLMQVEMANGKSLEVAAEATRYEADLDGITGFMYGCAVSVLAECWKHGDKLRRWHNLKSQIGNEGEEANKSGGTLNPALLRVKVGS